MKIAAVLLSALALLSHSANAQQRQQQRLGESHRDLAFGCDPGYQPAPSFGGWFSFGCDACPEGTAKNSIGNEDCPPCPPGTFAEGEQNEECSPCPDGEVNPDEGQGSCTACPGDSFPNPDSTSCTFPTPPVRATPAPTPAPVDGGMKMDPHVLKWDGTTYDYNGECDLVLLKASNFDGNGRDLTIHVRTAIRQSYSFISSAAVKIGDTVLEFSSWGQFSWDGITLSASRDLPADPSVEGYPFSYKEEDKRSHSYTIRLQNTDKIVVSSFKDFVNVNIHISRRRLLNSVGLMGDVHTGESLARDGTTVLEDPNEFGQEWQVLPTEDKLFMADRAPQAPEKCRLPVPREQRPDTQEEAVLRQAAEKTCEKWAKQNKNACVADIMATGNLEFAKSGVY